MAKCKSCGKFGILLKVNSSGLCKECELGEQISSLSNTVSELQTPEYQNLEFIRGEIEKRNADKAALEQQISSLNDTITSKYAVISSLDQAIDSKKGQIVYLDEAIDMQNFGLYEPNFQFQTVEEYKKDLDVIRSQEKEMIKMNEAATGLTNWAVNNSLSQGRKMVSDFQKLLIRAFNSECDELVSKVKYNNLEASIKRINSSCEAISKLGKIMGISISERYKALKISELEIAFRYSQAKQRQKEEEKAYREQLREEAKLQKEIEEERKKIKKEQTHYLNAIEKLKEQLSKDPENVDLQQKLHELNRLYEDTEKAMQDIDYREANKKAGYVYVISNIGSFGENVYKIGMTRRLNPKDRVDELGDASVPFKFDIHAMIFTEDAPALESSLHRAFEDKKLNLVNQRREFFNVTLDEIKEVVKRSYDKTVEFVDVPDAEQFRMSTNMRNSKATSD